MTHPTEYTPILTLFLVVFVVVSSTPPRPGTVIADYRRKLLLSRLIRNAKLSLMLYETWNHSKHNK